MSRMGRPPKYETVEQMEAIMDAYFADCDPHVEDVTEWVQARNTKGRLLVGKQGLPYLIEVTHKVITPQRSYNMAGLALHLGMTTRALIDYKAKDNFLPAIKRARQIIEAYKVEQLPNAKNVAGLIFDLKVNHGYREHEEENKPPENPIIFINNVPAPPDNPKP